jgi:hypothetical protein
MAESRVARSAGGTSIELKMKNRNETGGEWWAYHRRLRHATAAFPGE